ncbi:DUF6458 family protein [Conexibacter sp. JD483]|uniref:DUF6458 family protein n=1 Tax=unclassified Conexibacter TaxID=2627773 RepID=UPI00271E2753|nr:MULTISPECIES: DUF6458 family protein [unclassified Conexibacter]MDO8187239.1 DUF6458 family protein [Conexibacter sp. CPCC 205706]MDO8199336.1 DUF6458 family protein [Conexibacter sp. CPCC 205762]MDR9369263.1 DUF6458 family protein [Conexibacter sp. JD483]
MSIGGSIFVIAIGAILRFAVTKQVAGVDLRTVGLILMIAGGAALVIALTMLALANRDRDPGPGTPPGPQPPAGPPTRY